MNGENDKIILGKTLLPNWHLILFQNKEYFYCKKCKNVGTVWSLAERTGNIGEPGSKGGVFPGERMMET